MDIVRVTLKLKSPLGSEMVSGTLFGQMCWALRELESEAALVTWLSDEAALWCISDGMPHDLLPRPILAPAPPPENMDVGEAKKQKKRKFITRAGFIAARKNMTDAALVQHLADDPMIRHRSAHNTIDRRSGSTPDNAGLYFVDEFWTGEETASRGESNKRDVYVDAPAGNEKRIAALLSHLGETGFGRDASLGRGAWRIEKVAVDADLMANAGPRRMTLSRGAACDSTMNDIRCKLVAHYGKVGAQVAVSTGVSPFKYPLLLTVPGATFTPMADRRAGQLIKGVHPDRPEIVHNAFHVALSFTEGQT